jgi:hypothetical protein
MLLHREPEIRCLNKVAGRQPAHLMGHCASIPENRIKHSVLYIKSGLIDQRHLDSSRPDHSEIASQEG